MSPAQESLREQLESQRVQLFKAMGILDCIMASVDRGSVPADEPDRAYAAEAAHDLLDAAASRLYEIAEAFSSDDEETEEAQS